MSDYSQLDRLRAELRRPGRSQTDLARALGLHPSAVNKMLSGKRTIKARELATIEQYLRDTSSTLSDVIKRADAESPHKAIVTEVNTGLSSTSYPGPFAFEWDKDRISARIGRLVDIALKDRDGIALIFESWELILDNLKQYIIERLRFYDESDARTLLTSAAFDDFVLLRSLALTFGAFNEEEVSRLALLHQLKDMLRGDPRYVHLDAKTEVKRLIEEYAPIDPDNEIRSMPGRVLTATLRLNSILYDGRNNYLSRMDVEAQGVRRRRQGLAKK